MKILFKIVVLILIFTTPVKAQNFSGGYNFKLLYDDSTTVKFLPVFKQKQIESGFISTDTFGNFTKNGEAIRFWGGNLTTEGAFPTKTDAAKIAGRMRKMGINLIRFHHIDNPWSKGSLFEGITGTRSFNPVLLDRLDYLIYQLKQNGIYVDMNLNVSRTFENSDGVYAADSLQDFGKGLTLFNRHMINLEKEYAAQLLGHVNPYTGLKLAEDPVLAMVEIVNENSLFRRWYGNKLQPISAGGSLPLKYSLELDSLWIDFLNQKYTNNTNLKQAWNGNIVLADTLMFDNFENGLNTEKWQLEQHENAQASFELFTENNGNHAVLVKAIKHGSQSWHITFKNIGNSAQKDSVYELTFRAKSDARHSMSAGFQRNNSPYTYYGGADFTVDTTFQTYRVTFKAPENNSNQLRLWFRFDGNTGDFYIDDMVYKKTSADGLLENESLTTKSIKRIPFSEIHSFTKQRIKDQTDFYIQVQMDFLTEMKSFLRDSLKVKVPLAGTNWYTGPEDVYVQNTLDYLDNHAYWDHPQFPGQPWSQTDWKINNQPMMKGTSSTIESLFNGLSVKGKPYTVSEYNHGYPNQFQAEMLPIITSYLSFNGADAVMFFTYSGSWDWQTDALYGYFDLHRNNAVMAGFPVYSYVYRNRLIKEAPGSVVVNYHKNDMLTMPLEAETSWGTHSPFPKQLSYSNKVELTFDEEKPTDLSQVPTPGNSPYNLNNGEIFWNKNGLFVINTENFCSVTGELNNNSGVQTQSLKLLSGNGFGSIAWLSLVDSALNESSKSLLFVGSKQINTNMLWDGTTSVHNNWGTAPSLIAPLTLKLQLKNNAAGLKIIPLNRIGQPDTTKAQYFVTQANGYSNVTLNTGADKTLWYGVETIADWSTTDANQIQNQNKVSCYPNPSDSFVFFESAKTFDLMVFDVSGKKILSSKSKSNYKINKNEIGEGIFIFKATGDKNTSTGKFVIN